MEFCPLTTVTLLARVFQCSLCSAPKVAVRNSSFPSCFLSLVLVAVMADTPQMDVPEDERDPVVVKPVPVTKSNIEYSLRDVVGQIISHKILNKKAIRTIMFKTWEEYKGLTITDMGDNKFLFTFPSVSNAEEMLTKAPWFVMNQLISLQRWGEGIAFSDINFDIVPFWIQIHGLLEMR